MYVMLKIVTCIHLIFLFSFMFCIWLFMSHPQSMRAIGNPLKAPTRKLPLILEEEDARQNAKIPNGKISLTSLTEPWIDPYLFLLSLLQLDVPNKKKEIEEKNGLHEMLKGVLDTILCSAPIFSLPQEKKETPKKKI